jgi:hypothetical protein
MQLEIRTNIGKNLESLGQDVQQKIINAVNHASEQLYSLVMSKYVNPISRTGKFAESVRSIPVKTVEKNRMQWGIEFGTPYVRAIVGSKGAPLIIVPRRGRVSSHPGSEPHLTIPIGPAVGRYTSPLQVKDLRLVVHGGNAYLAKKPDKNTFIPYFILKKRVEIERKIFPDEIRADAQRLIAVRLRENFKDILS